MGRRGSVGVFHLAPAEDKAPEHGRKKLVRKLLRGKVPDVILDRKHKTGFDESILARVDYDSLRNIG